MACAGPAPIIGPARCTRANGTIQAVVDERADEKQREALITILSGREQVDGTFFQIISMIVTNILTPRFLPIEFAFDLENRTARMAVPGMFETNSEPIKNPVTGDPHRIRINIPNGFEYREAEIASAATKGTGEIKFDNDPGHSSMAYVEFTESGLG